MVAIVLQHGYSYLIVNILYQAASTAKNICNYTIRNHGQVPFEAVKCYILHNSCYSRHVYVYVAGLFGYSVISNHSLLWMSNSYISDLWYYQFQPFVVLSGNCIYIGFSKQVLTGIQVGSYFISCMVAFQVDDR